MKERHSEAQDLRAAKWSGLGGMAAAGAFALSWVCCLPLAAGASGAALALAANIGWSLRPWFAGAAVLLVGLALYRAYRSVPCGPDGCADERRRRRIRLLVWGLAVLVAALISLPWWSAYVIYWLL